MGAITDLWKSERGLVCVALIIAATVLTGLGKLTVPEWKDYTLYLFYGYAAAKTITGAVQIAKGTPAPAPGPVAAPVAPATP